MNQSHGLSRHRSGAFHVNLAATIVLISIAPTEIKAANLFVSSLPSGDI